MECLFENYEKQPPELAKICDKYADIDADQGLNYEDVANFLEEVEAIGYTFESYLDAVPFNLVKKE